MTLEDWKDELTDYFPHMDVKAPGSIRVQARHTTGSYLYYDCGDGYLVINTISGSFDLRQAVAISREISDLIEVAKHIKEVERDL